MPASMPVMCGCQWGLSIDDILADLTKALDKVAADVREAAE